MKYGSLAEPACLETIEKCCYRRIENHVYNRIKSETISNKIIIENIDFYKFYQKKSLIVREIIYHLGMVEKVVVD